MGTGTPTVAVSSAPAAASRRPFYRLHASTWLLLTPFVLLLLVLIEPSLFLDEGQAYSCEHGWPWTFLRREIISKNALERAAVDADFNGTPMVFPPGTPAVERLTAIAMGEEPSGYPDWFHGWAWRIGGIREWRLGLLAADVAVALLIAFGVAVILEWRRRRHARAWQFSLGELGCIVALVACALGWWRANFESSRVQLVMNMPNQAVLVLPDNDVEISLERESSPPEWLRRLLGPHQVDRFGHATSMEIGRWTFTEAPEELWSFRSLQSLKIKRVHEGESLAQWLASLRSVKVVEVYPIRPHCIAPLCRSGKLTSLDLGDYLAMRVHDAELEYLAASPRLRKLDLERADITDEGLDHVLKLADLEVLVLEKTKVTGAGVAKLAALKKLERLSLVNTAVTDEALQSLSVLPNLKDLDLQGAPSITNAGMAHVARLPNLESLNLRDTQIDDAGVLRLLTAKSLGVLRLREDQITVETKKQLEVSLPDCWVNEPAY